LKGTIVVGVQRAILDQVTNIIALIIWFIDKCLTVYKFLVLGRFNFPANLMARSLSYSMV